MLLCSLQVCRLKIDKNAHIIHTCLVSCCPASIMQLYPEQTYIFPNDQQRVVSRTDPSDSRRCRCGRGRRNRLSLSHEHRNPQEDNCNQSFDSCNKNKKKKANSQTAFLNETFFHTYLKDKYFNNKFHINKHKLVQFWKGATPA